jgi:two-component system sensor histidine kinase HydH
MVEDLTARKEAEQAARKYQRLALLGEMAAGLAHEIRNPAATISAQAQYLMKKMGKGANPYREPLKDVLAQCERLETLVRDTMDYSPQKKFEEREEVPVKALLEKALKLAQTQFGPSHSRVKVKWAVAARLPALSVNRGRMERVFVNLILNAFQAMPRGGCLSLKSKRLDHRILLRVEDDGKGVAPADLSKLFEPFFTSRKTGSGLGLAICQKIVEEHGGEIKAENVKPKGAAFVVELPLPEGKGR